MTQMMPGKKWTLKQPQDFLAAATQVREDSHNSIKSHLVPHGEPKYGIGMGLCMGVYMVYLMVRIPDVMGLSQAGQSAVADWLSYMVHASSNMVLPCRHCYMSYIHI